MIDLSQILPIAVVCGFVVGIGLIVWEICVGKHFRRVPLWVLTLLILVFVPVTLLLHLDGRINLPAPVSSSLQLLVAQGTSSAEIVSLNAHDGTQLWQRTLDVDNNGSLISQSFTLSGSTIYGVVSDQAHPGSTAYAVNGNSGAVLWKTQLAPQSPPSNSLAAVPVVADGRVYLLFYEGSDAASVLALHASDGSQAWSAKLANFQRDSPSPTLLAGNGRLFVTNTAGDLRALRSSDGSLAWNAQIVDQQRPLIQSNTVNVCALVGDLLYTIAPDRQSIVGLRASDGQAVWHLDLGNLSVASLNIIHDHLYLSTINSNGGADTFYVFDLQDARLLWKSHLGCVMPALTESGATVYSACSSTLSALRLDDGSQIWTKTSSGTYSLYDRPLLVDGVLFVQTVGFPMRYTRAAAPTIDALSSSDGSYYWRYTFPGSSSYNNTGFFLGAL